MKPRRGDLLPLKLSPEEATYRATRPIDVAVLRILAPSAQRALRFNGIDAYKLPYTRPPLTEYARATGRF